MASSGTTSTRKRFTGAEFIVHFLEQQGIKIVTGIPGGSILPVYDALSQSTQIRHILARHEQGAGFIAQGMARTDGKPAVCMACSGPGATNLVTAIADARLDSIPLICITGQVPASMIGTDAFQEVDTYGISIPITKHNYLVRHIEELPQVMSDAFRIAQSGRPGPVWIDIPKDVQTAVFEIEAQPAVAEKAAAPAFSEESIRDAAAMINAAKRPVLYLGGGVINAPARVRELAEKAQLPTTMTLMALGMLPKAHPLSLGMLGMHGVRSTNYILQEADLLIVLGARFDDRAIGKTEQFCPNAKIIHVDIDRAELGKIKQPHVAIQADVDDVLAQLIPLVEAQPRAEWHQLVADLQREFPCPIPKACDPLSHYGLINAVAACVDDNAIITTDVGQHQMWTAQAYPLNRPRQWLTSGGLGTMGFGLPAAIGAALANPAKAAVVRDATAAPSSGAATTRSLYSCPHEGCRWNRKHAKFQPLKSVICAKNHYKRSHCPKMYVCNRCNRKHFSVLSDLRTHEKHCGDHRWLCSCGTSFSRKDKLIGHLALFSGHQPAVPLDR